jgi:magnesium chelatase family protein
VLIGHQVLMMGSPGAGKSMLAARLPSILPPLSPSELLEVSMIASVAGEIRDGALTAQRPFRSPHHSASMAALTGGGLRAKPGEISLSHHGVLFLDELPEFDPRVLDSLRQPLENGEVSVSRANHRVTYPARFMLVAAMNPCRCGHAFAPGFSCKRNRIERCTADYQARISGPLMDRIDLRIEVPAVSAADLILPPPAEGSAEVAARVAAARDIQAARYAGIGLPNIRTNAEAPASVLETIAQPDAARHQTVARGVRDHAALGARLSPRAARRADAGRSRWRREDHPAASGRGLVLSRARRRFAARGVISPPSSFRGATKVASYDVQLHIVESIAPHQRQEKWIPDSRCAASGMTKRRMPTKRSRSHPLTCRLGETARFCPLQRIT